ncbi:MAG: hypothetical protein BWK76_01290 [Desulfobulbaceae bacterium A2]|nr:MAG: hypothetical protein BWK76_01290 [Desulfobulbaceae bacterium A2]
MGIGAVGLSDVGRRRSHNEDVCRVDEARGFFLVADGMGGASAGEVASGLFAATAGDVFVASAYRPLEETVFLVKKSFYTANARILSDIEGNPSRAGMGCTAELFALYDQGFVLGHIGDSRTYRLRNSSLVQLTKDHSLVQYQIDQGLINDEQARSHPMKNVIMRAVGVNRELAVDIIQGPVFSGDLFLLCTDGLSAMVDDLVIRDILLVPEPLSQRAARLIQQANEAGGRDNVSVVLIEAP